MLESRELITRKIDMLPINVVYRNMAQANFAAAEASIAFFASVIAWFCTLAASTSTAIHRSQAREDRVRAR